MVYVACAIRSRLQCTIQCRHACHDEGDLGISRNLWEALRSLVALSMDRLSKRFPQRIVIGVLYNVANPCLDEGKNVAIVSLRKAYLPA